MAHPIPLLTTPIPTTKLHNACSLVINAFTTFPFMVGGSKRFCTDLMQTCKGRIIGKLGAEGVYGMGVVNKGIGCAIKIDDGTTGPQYNIASKFLECLHIFSKEDLLSLANYKQTPIYNCQKILTGYRKVLSEVLNIAI